MARMVKKYLYNGKEYILSQAAKEFGIKYITLAQRIKKGMTFEEAIGTPVDERNKIYFYKGKEYTLRQAAKEFGINYQTLRNRINRDGMTFEEAVKTPEVKTYIYNKEKYTLPQAAKEFGIDYQTLRNRINRGMTLEEAIKFDNPKFIDWEKKNG